MIYVEKMVSAFMNVPFRYLTRDSKKERTDYNAIQYNERTCVQLITFEQVADRLQLLIQL